MEFSDTSPQHCQQEGACSATCGTGGRLERRRECLGFDFTDNLTRYGCMDLVYVILTVPSRKLTYPTKREKEDHRLKSAKR